MVLPSVYVLLHNIYIYIACKDTYTYTYTYTYFNSVSTNSHTLPSTNLFLESASLATRSSGRSSRESVSWLRHYWNITAPCGSSTLPIHVSNRQILRIHTHIHNIQTDTAGERIHEYTFEIIKTFNPIKLESWRSSFSYFHVFILV